MVRRFLPIDILTVYIVLEKTLIWLDSCLFPFIIGEFR